MLQKGVVVIGQIFEKLRTRALFAVRHGLRHVDFARCVAVLIIVGLARDQIDIASDFLTVADRHLTGDQRSGGNGLKRLDQFGHANTRLIDFIGENDRRNVVLFEELEEAAHSPNTIRIRFADHNSEIHAQQRIRRLGEKFDRTGAVQYREVGTLVF
jgi:hypothetical protein